MGLLSRSGTTRPHPRAQAGSRLLASKASEPRRRAGGPGLEPAEHAGTLKSPGGG